MKKTLQLSIPALATLFWGIAVVYLYAIGRLGEFLVPRFHTITLLGGLGMIVLALFVMLTSREDSDCGHDHCEHEHDHHDQNPLVIALLMILPLSAALAADTSNGFSLDLLERKGLYDNNRDLTAYQIAPFTREMLENSTPRSDEGRFQLPLSQLFFSAGDQSMMDVFKGVPIETEGQVVLEREEAAGSHRLRIYRTLMTCCAADAMVLSFPIQFASAPPVFEERSWVRIGGTLRYEEEGGDLYPVMDVEEITAIPSPNEVGQPLW